MASLEKRLSDYDSGKVTSNREIIKLFSELALTGKIKTLPASYKKVLKDFIEDGYINDDGTIE